MVIGRFLEYTVAAPDLIASLDFYARLGLSQAQVGEAWPHPYAVVSDGRICLGLHGAPRPAPSLTFVRANVLAQLDALERLGLEMELRHLGDDVFNELGWRDPDGHLIRVLEARTFSPVKRAPTMTSICGYFQEIALPAAAPAVAKGFWEKLGFIGLEAPEAALPHVACTSDSIDIGLYPRARLPAPLLIFEVEDLGAARAQLLQAGIEAGDAGPAAALGAGCLLTAPEGTQLLLLEGPLD